MQLTTEQQEMIRVLESMPNGFPLFANYDTGDLQELVRSLQQPDSTLSMIEEAVKGGSVLRLNLREVYLAHDGKTFVCRNSVFEPDKPFPYSGNSFPEAVKTLLGKD